MVPVRRGRRPIQSFLLVCKGFALEKISKNKDYKEMGERSWSEEQEKLQNERKRFSKKKSIKWEISLETPNMEKIN